MPEVINGFRPWQVGAFEKFYSKRRCYLISPPGQGKSIAGQSFAVQWAERGKKVLIATPRTLITQSFKGTHAFKWDSTGKVDSPSAEEHTFSYSEPKKEFRKLATWMVAPLDPSYPYYVTTHQAALRALESLRAEHGDLPGHIKYRDLAVIIDEAHLMKDSEDSELGKVLKDLVANDVPVLIMTGTPYRGDDEPILSEELCKEFVPYVREFYEALDESEFLGGFDLKTIVGSTLPVLRNILSTFEAENRYAVIKLPRVNTRHSKRLARELGLDPEADMDDLVLQLKLRFDKEIENICNQLGLKHLSIVDGKSSTVALDKLLERARKEKDGNALATYFPRVVVAQDKIGLGVDCPWWTDSIMLGASRSCTETVQFGMRCCRDHSSKTERNVRYWTLVPEYWEPEVSIEKARDFAEELVATQLWWHFIGGGPAAPDIKTQGSTTSDGGRRGTIPPSPKALTQATIEAAKLQAVNEGTHKETPIFVPTVSIDMAGPDGKVKKAVTVGHTGDGNKLYPLASPHLPEGLVSTGNFLLQLNHLAEVLISRGQAGTTHTLLKKAQVTSKLICDMYREGKSVSDITAETGEFPTNIEKILTKEGLIKEKSATKARIRGGKEDRC